MWQLKIKYKNGTQTINRYPNFGDAMGVANNLATSDEIIYVKLSFPK